MTRVVNMTVRQYAEYTGYAPWTIRKYCRDGLIEGAFHIRDGVKPHWRIKVLMEEEERPTAEATATGQ